MSICANHHANHKKVRKSMPTIVPTTFNKWQNSAEKSQAHNLKVVGSNPTPATNLFNKIKNLYHPQRIRFLGFFVIILSVCTNHYTNRSSGFFHFNDHNSHCLYFLACFISSILYSSDELQLFPNFKK